MCIFKSIASIFMNLVSLESLLIHLLDNAQISIFSKVDKMYILLCWVTYYHSACFSNYRLFFIDAKICWFHLKFDRYFVLLYKFIKHMWHDQGKWVTCRKFQFLVSYTTFSNFKMLHFDAKPITIGYLVIELWRIWQC